MRLTLGSLIGFLAFGVLGYLVLAYPTGQWKAVLENTYWALLLLMLVSAVAGKGRPRSFALGFATASLAYFAVCFGPAVHIRSRILTHQALVFVMEQLHANSSTLAADIVRQEVVRPASLEWNRVRNSNLGAEGQEPRTASSGPADPDMRWPRSRDASSLRTTREPVDPHTFFHLGHMLWTLALGFVGGAVGSSLVVDPVRRRSTGD